MSILSQHIEYLLISRDCVILPGVGAFIVSYRSARIDETGSRILPPSRDVSFNPAVTADDGLLAHSIARRYRLPFEEARERLEELIAGLRRSLEESGLVELGMVGRLTVGPEGGLIFTPALDAQAQWTRLGISPLAFPRRSVPRASDESSSDIRKDMTARSSKTLPCSSDIPCSSDMEERVEVAEETGRKINDGYYHFRISKRALRVAASLLLALGVCLSVVLFPLDTATEKGEKMASILPAWKELKQVSAGVGESVTALLPADKSATASVADDAEASESAEGSPEEKETSVEASERPVVKSHLIVGAFKTEAGARAFIEQKSKEGVEGLEIVTTPRGNRLVSAYSGTPEAVRAEMNRPSTRALYPESWILN